MPLDIFVPFWGDPGLLRETVDSVLAQECGDWLLTVVDDAYPDPGVARWFATLDDPRLTYVRKPVNEGITANFRTCASMATQDRVVILGCDDLLEPGYVGVVLDAHAEFPDASVIQPGVRVVDETGRVVRPLADRVKQQLLAPRTGVRLLLSGEPLATGLLHGNWLYWPSLAFRRDVLAATGFRETTPLIQDLALVLDLVTAGGTVLVEPSVCFRYRRHGASASTAALLDGTRFRWERAFFDRAAVQVGALGWYRARRAARLHLTSRLNALSLVPRALLSAPRHLPTLLRHGIGPARP